MSVSDTTKFDADAGQVPASGGEPAGKMSNIAGLFKNKKTRNVLVLTAVVMAVIFILAWMSLSSSSKTAIPEAYQPGVAAGTTPGTLRQDQIGVDSPRHNTLAKTIDRKNAEDAEEKGKSFQPTAFGGYEYLPNEDRKIKPDSGTIPPVTQNRPPSNPQTDESLRALATATQNAVMRNIALWDAPKTPKLWDVADVQQVAMVGNTEVAGNQANNPSSSKGQPDKAEPIVLIPAGHLAPVLINIPMNSAEPGTLAMATLLTGEFKGSRLTGTFAKNKNDTLRANFTTMTVSPYEVTIPIQAYSVNPDDAFQQGIVTDVDRHIFTKYVLRPTAAALSSIGQAFARQGTTVIGIGSTVTQNKEIDSRDAIGIGVGAAANTFQQDISTGEIENTVVVRRDTVVGVVFAKSAVYGEK